MVIANAEVKEPFCDTSFFFPPQLVEVSSAKIRTHFPAEASVETAVGARFVFCGCARAQKPSIDFVRVTEMMDGLTESQPIST